MSVKQEEETRLLARQIWRAQVEKGLVGKALPCERRIAEEFGTTRHAVRKALQVLEIEGSIVRFSRRAAVPSFPLPEPSPNRRIRCITFVRGPCFASEQLRWVVEDHLAGYTEALEAHEIKTRFVTCADDVTDYERLLWPQVPFHEQACVLVSRAMPGLLNWLRGNRIPFVIQYNHAYALDGLPEHHSAFINKVGGGYTAARHLIDLGHTRIGFAGETNSSISNVDVYLGYQAAMNTRAIPILPAFLWPVHTDRLPEALDPVREFLRRTPRPTALVAENDTAALAVLKAAAECGIRVPQDLSVVGFNDQAEAAVSTPPLTTIRTPRRALARAAVDMLLASFDAPAGYRKKILECELVPRHSTAKPREPG